MSIRDLKIETMPREELKKLQGERLVKQVKRMYENVECFRNRMIEKGLTPNDIKGVEDLPKLPFSYKSDLRDYYPYGLFAEPLENIVRVHASSGTTGKRIVVGYTNNDLDMWSECIARMLQAVGLTKEDIFQVSFGYGLFTGGFGLHAGIEKVGAMVIPMSSGNTPLQIQTMIDFKATAICCTPSYAMYLGEEIERLGVKDQLSLKIGIFGAEPWSENMRTEIENKLGIKAYDIYGLSEILGPGVSCECEYQCGMHVWEDHFIPEIIDPDTCEVLPEGSQGELVFTTITKEGFPVIRYRTRDICSLQYEKCKCGRTHVRMNKPSGRSDDMLIIRGVNVFPSQVESALINCDPRISPHYHITVDRINNLDIMSIEVELARGVAFDEVKVLEELTKKLSGDIASAIGISAKVKLVSSGSLARSEGKAKLVTDNRKI